MERLLAKTENGNWTCNSLGTCNPKHCDWCRMRELIFRKCAEYEDAEEQGLLHKAPLSDGTPIFVIHDEEFMELFEGDYEPIGGTTYLYGHTEFVYGKLGDGYFLTWEEAETALSRRKAGE